MKTFLVIAVCFFTVSCFGQTKLISFRSHSGNNTNFRTAVEHNMFDIVNSNFGIVPIYITKIDTVMLKGNNKIIISRKTGMGNGGRSKYYQNTTDTLTKANTPAFFNANNIDSLKNLIQKQYRAYKTVALDSTQFIGFDKQFKQTKAVRKQPKNK